jgi:hypothetical protein
MTLSAELHQIAGELSMVSLRHSAEIDRIAEKVRKLERLEKTEILRIAAE